MGWPTGVRMDGQSLLGGRTPPAQPRCTLNPTGEKGDLAQAPEAAADRSEVRLFGRNREPVSKRDAYDTATTAEVNLEGTWNLGRMERVDLRRRPFLEHNSKVGQNYKLRCGAKRGGGRHRNELPQASMPGGLARGRPREGSQGGPRSGRLRDICVNVSCGGDTVRFLSPPESWGFLEGDEVFIIHKINELSQRYAAVRLENCGCSVFVFVFARPCTALTRGENVGHLENVGQPRSPNRRDGECEVRGKKSKNKMNQEKHASVLAAEEEEAREGHGEQQAHAGDLGGGPDDLDDEDGEREDVFQPRPKIGQSPASLSLIHI